MQPQNSWFIYLSSTMWYNCELFHWLDVGWAPYWVDLSAFRNSHTVPSSTGAAPRARSPGPGPNQPVPSLHLPQQKNFSKIFNGRRFVRIQTRMLPMRCDTINYIAIHWSCDKVDESLGSQEATTDYRLPTGAYLNLLDIWNKNLTRKSTFY